MTGRDDRGRRFGLYAELVSRYTHGTCRVQDLDPTDDYPLLRLGLEAPGVEEDEEGMGAAFFLSIGEARRMAAALTRAADAADGFEWVLPDARRERRERTD